MARALAAFACVDNATVTTPQQGVFMVVALCTQDEVVGNSTNCIYLRLKCNKISHRLGNAIVSDR